MNGISIVHPTDLGSTMVPTCQSLSPIREPFSEPDRKLVEADDGKR